MPRRRRVLLEREVRLSELERAYRRERDARVRERILLVKLVKQGYSCTQVAELIGVSHQKVARWVRRFNEGGLEALRDRPRGKPKPKVSDEELLSILRTSPRELGYPYDGWYFTLLKVELERRGVSYSVSRLWKRVTRLGYRLKRPRPRHHRAERSRWVLFKKE